MPKPASKIEFFYFPRAKAVNPKAPELLEVVFFRERPGDPLTSTEGQVVALFVYAGDAVDYATRRRASIQAVISDEGEIEAILLDMGVAAPEGGVIRFEIEPGRASAVPLWGIVVRPSKTQLRRET